MADTSDIKKGICIKFNDKVHQIIDFQHVKPGKGPAFVRTKMKNLENSRMIDNTFTAGIKIELVRVEHREYQFLYKEEAGFVFMHSETFEQVVIPEHFIENPLFLRDGDLVKIVFNADEESPLYCELQAHIIFEIAYAEPAVKGNTANAATKKATTDTGAEINVPLFVNVGDKVKVNSETGEYMERVK
jgi:elongation factor P